MPDFSKEDFSRNLKILLESRGISQLDLATAIGCSTSIVSDWCKGRKTPRMDRAQAVADFFGVPVSVLMSSETPAVQSYTVELNAAEYQHIVAYRAADDTARAYAFETLIHHPRRR